MFLTILGFFSGIIGGMGMGGGTILIPALILFAHIDPKIAQSVNLAKVEVKKWSERKIYVNF